MEILKAAQLPLLPIDVSVVTPRRHPIVAPLVAVGLLFPALAGCPGRLATTAGFFNDGGGLLLAPAQTNVEVDGAPAVPRIPDAAPPAPALPNPTPPVVFLDAAPTPAPAPTPTPAPAPGPSPDAPALAQDAAAMAPAGVPAACSQPAAIQMLFQAKCNLCHSTAMKAGMLDLEAAGAKARIVGQQSRICVGKPLGAADGTGFLVDKLAGPPPGGCGQQMPFGGLPPLSPDEITCIKNWLRGQ
jgi:hypothetical protein